MEELQIALWSKPPSEAEDERSLKALQESVAAVREKFGQAVHVIRQGSHYNRTNIRLDSDVDVSMVNTGYYFSDTKQMSAAAKAIFDGAFIEAGYSFAAYKNDVEASLRAKFAARVQRRNKCILVAGTPTRNSCDVVPAFEHRRYGHNGEVLVKGIEFVTDSGERVVSFPEQHYANGNNKNDLTARVYKRTVRVLKRARNKLIDDGKMQDGTISSFFIECLAYNLPNNVYEQGSWRARMEEVTARIWNDMRNPAVSGAYTEVSGWKWLFEGNRTPKHAEDFALLAWHLFRS